MCDLNSPFLKKLRLWRRRWRYCDEARRRSRTLREVGPKGTGLAMTGFLQALFFLCTLGAARNAESQRAPAPRAVPVEPIGAILDAFRSHAIVALGEGLHGNEQGHAFRLTLIRDPRFAVTVNDIVVECGNAKYQDLMDRFTGRRNPI